MGLSLFSTHQPPAAMASFTPVQSVPMPGISSVFGGAKCPHAHNQGCLWELTQPRRGEGGGGWAVPCHIGCVVSHGAAVVLCCLVLCYAVLCCVVRHWILPL